MNILVCGSSGFIGSNLVKRLLDEGHYVVGADINEPKHVFPTKFYNADLRNWSQASYVFSSCGAFDRVYQLAADMGGAGHIFTGDNDADLMRNSSLINLNVAALAVQYRIKKLFYSSSVCAYSPEQVSERVPEESIYPANPDSNYGWEKLFSERVYQAHAKNKGLNIRIARFNNCFGPYCTWRGGKEKSPAALCRKALTEDTVQVWGDGQQIREFIYIDDLLDAVEIIMQSDHTDPINIGPDEYYTIDQLVRTVTDKEISHVDGPVGLQIRLTDNTKIKALGWTPKVSVKEGMQKLKSWIQTQLQK